MARSFFTPDPSRKVNAYGALSRKRIGRIRQELVQLAQQSDRPITVYIDSPGGKLDFIHSMRETPFARKPGETFLPLITVVRGRAESSAAYLLILGDYAYAQPESRLLLHGAGYFSLRKNVKINRPEAAVMAMRLDEKNRTIAKRLARRVVRRLAWRHHQLAARAPAKKTNAPWILTFFQSLLDEVATEKSRILLTEACEHFLAIYPETAHLQPSRAEQFAILKKWTSHRLQHYRQNTGGIDGVAALELATDLAHVSDLLADDFLATFPQLLQSHGSYLLTAKEAAAYRACLKKNPAQAEKLLRKQAGPRLTQLRCLAHALCWRLLIGENEIAPTDAYWMGLVDEITGTKLTGERLKKKLRP